MSDQEKKKIKNGALIGGIAAVVFTILASLMNIDFSDTKTAFCGCPNVAPSPMPSVVIIQEGK